MKRESDQTLARARAWAYIVVAKATVIVSVQLRPVVVFSGSAWAFMICPSELEGEHSIAHCDLFANYLASKINCIHSQLDAGIQRESLDICEYLSCPILWDCFWVMQLEALDRIFGEVQATTFVLNSCPSRLIKAG